MVGSQIWWPSIGTRYPEADERLAATIADLVLGGIGAHDSPDTADDASSVLGDPPGAQSTAAGTLS